MRVFRSPRPVQADVNFVLRPKVLLHDIKHVVGSRPNSTLGESHAPQVARDLKPGTLR
jgi:hypothetical protein